MRADKWCQSRRAYLTALVTAAGFGGCLGLEEPGATPTGTPTGPSTADEGADSTATDDTAPETADEQSEQSLPDGTRWTFTADGPFVAGPVLADGTVIATSVDRTVYGVDAATGEQRWAAATETALENGLDVVDGTAVPAGIEEQLGVGIGDGETTYQHVDFDLGVRAQVGDDSRVYQARIVTGGVRAVDPTNGEVVWSDRTAKRTDAERPNERVDTVALDGETLCVGVQPESQNGVPPWGFAAYDTDTGDQLWYVERDLDFDYVSPDVAVSDGICYGAIGNHYLALDARTGDILVEEERTATPVYGAVDGTVLVARNGALHGADIATGETRWQSDVSPSGPTALDGSTFWFVSDGTLYESDVTSGSVRERQSLAVGDTSLTGDLVVTDRTVFVTTEDSTLRALERQ